VAISGGSTIAWAKLPNGPAMRTTGEFNSWVVKVRIASAFLMSGDLSGVASNSTPSRLNH